MRNLLLAFLLLFSERVLASETFEFSAVGQFSSAEEASLFNWTVERPYEFAALLEFDNTLPVSAARTRFLASHDVYTASYRWESLSVSIAGVSYEHSLKGQFRTGDLEIVDSVGTVIGDTLIVDAYEAIVSPELSIFRTVIDQSSGLDIFSGLAASHFNADNWNNYVSPQGFSRATVFYNCDFQTGDGCDGRLNIRDVDIRRIGAVPEPKSWLMLIFGFVLTGIVFQKRKSKRTMCSL